MRPRSLTSFAKVHGRRFKIEDATWAFGGVEIRSVCHDEKLCACPTRGHAEMICQALERVADQEGEQPLDLRL